MVFALASFSMSAQSDSHLESLGLNSGCWNYAQSAAESEESAYGLMTDFEFNQVGEEYYDFCMDSGGSGNVLDPVFL